MKLHMLKLGTAMLVCAVGLPSLGQAHKETARHHHYNRETHRDRGSPAFAIPQTPSSFTALDASFTGKEADLVVMPPTFATSPRSYGASYGPSYGPSYFDRTMDSGPAKRGLAYNVRRRR